MVRPAFVIVSLLALAATGPTALAGVDVFVGAGSTCIAAGTDAIVDLAAPHCGAEGGGTVVPLQALILIVGVRIDGNDVCFLVDDNGNPSLSCTGPVCHAAGREVCNISAIDVLQAQA